MTDLPRHDDFYLPTLRVLDRLGGSASIEEIQQALTEDLNFTDAQLNERYPKSGALVLPDRMSWARTYLKYPGLLSNPKTGVWALTEDGRQAVKWTEEQVRAAVTQAAQEAYRANVAAKAAKQSVADEQRALELSAAGEGTWSDKLLSTLQSMDPSAFERLSQRLLRESGFVKVEVTGKSGDGGIDGYGVLRVNLISFQVLFQCKRYKNSVTPSLVRDFRGAMQGRAYLDLELRSARTAVAGQRAERDHPLPL